jgi:hypothetical protein
MDNVRLLEQVDTGLQSRYLNIPQGRPSSCEAKLANVLQDAPEISAWCEAHGSISGYEGDPDLLTR